MPIYRFVHLLKLDSGHPEQGEVAGAFGLGLVRAPSADDALSLATSNYTDHHYIIENLEEGPNEVERDHFSDDDSALELFDAALAYGECYAYHKWPIDRE